jgi:transposase-like protein
VADAALDVERSITDAGLGAVQGVVVRDGRVYASGDVFWAEPRVGVIREYTEELEPTGRVVWLRRDGKPLIMHPTGVAWHDRWGTFLWSLLRSWLRPHRGISQEKLPIYLGFFEFIHNVRKRGKALLEALIGLLVT